MSRSAARDRACRDPRLLGAFLDGELDPASHLEVEAHLRGCEVCRERVELDRAMRGTLKRVVRSTAADGLDGLRARALAAMEAEQARGEARERAQQDRGRLLGWRTMVPVATAAAFAIFWASARHGPWAGDAPGSHTAAGFASEDLLAELVAEHSSLVPPQWTDPKDVRALDQYVGVPVRPGSFERSGARLVGGRVLPMHQQHAAMLQYVIGNGPQQRRLSVFVYDPHKIQISGPALAPRAVGTAQVQVGRENGYSVAVTQHAGVGYAVASDLDPDRSAQLAALADDTPPDE